jgi:hypothetical protein
VSVLYSEDHWFEGKYNLYFVSDFVVLLLKNITRYKTVMRLASGFLLKPKTSQQCVHSKGSVLNTLTTCSVLLRGTKLLCLKTSILTLKKVFSLKRHASFENNR